jgi:gamma-glutamyltranspeptidase / glutathione hydrolase
MIASTTGSIAIHIGLQVLKAGGSAMDAAIATSLAQIVLSGGSWNSFAGILSALYFESSTGSVHSLSAGFQTLQNERDPMSIPCPPTPSGRTALVPGFMAGIEAASQRFGRIPLRSLCAPAHKLAEDGFEVDPLLAAAIAERKEILAGREATRSVFFRQSGDEIRPYREGELLRQPELARTLEALAENGASWMYMGPWASRFVEAATLAGSSIALGDLQAYRAEWGIPISTTYGGARVFTLGAPDNGGFQLLEGLNVLSASGLGTRPHYSSDARSLFDFLRICQFGQISTAATRQLARQDAGRTLAELNAERLDFDSARLAWSLLQEPDWAARYYRARVGPGHSDAIVAADEDGNVAVMVHSINTLFWGTTGLFVDGVSIPDSAASQQSLIALAGLGQRVPTPMNPVIVTRNGKPWIAAASIGVSVHESMMANLSNMIDFRMSPLNASKAPKFSAAIWPEPGVEEAPVHVVIDGEFSSGVLEGVSELGQTVRETPRTDAESALAHWTGIEFMPDSHHVPAGVS